MNDQPRSRRRVLAIWLDGFDMEIADMFELEHLGRLAALGAVATLDAGETHRTGLAGEHLSTGLDPDSARRASPVSFDRKTYGCTQDGANHPPVFAGVPTVVLDPCYFDLRLASADVQGVTDWGSHDPGGPPDSRPDGLGDEVRSRFPSRPAGHWMYATPWESAADCAEMGQVLTDSVDQRSNIAAWLLGERLPDWQLGIVGVHEAHSATEGLYHGIDPEPRWQTCESRDAAANSLRDVYMAVDRLIGRLVDQFPDALHAVFTMHGMGPNNSDVPSILLLGELLRRWSGASTPTGAMHVDSTKLPRLPAEHSWGVAVDRAFDPVPVGRAHQAWRRLPEPVRRAVRRVLPSRAAEPVDDPTGLKWMPLMRHQPYWYEMRAFALPSYYDGRVRLNIRGRERDGIVDPAQYSDVLDEVEQLLMDCRDPITGQPVIHRFERPLSDPMSANASDVDLMVLWADGVYGMTHPTLGTIGPVAPRRTGGHRSSIGRFILHGHAIEAADVGVWTCFDVVPTLLDLAGGVAAHPINGVRIPIVVG